MKPGAWIGLGIFAGIVGSAFVLRRELRRAPEVRGKASRRVWPDARLQAEERRQRPEGGRN